MLVSSGGQETLFRSDLADHCEDNGRRVDLGFVVREGCGRNEGDAAQEVVVRVGSGCEEELEGLTIVRVAANGALHRPSAPLMDQVEGVLDGVARVVSEAHLGGRERRGGKGTNAICEGVSRKASPFATRGVVL